MFNAQDAANSLWAAATLGLRDESFFRVLVSHVLGFSLSEENSQQLLYVHSATRLWLSAPLLFSSEHLETLRARSTPERSIVSQSQRDVAASLSRLGFSVEMEARVLDGLHAVDALVHLPGGSLVAVEFDGPTHFLRRIHSATGGHTFSPNGATLFRDRLLREAGFDVIAVPFFEWYELVDDASRDAYISTRLNAARARGDESIRC
jgi:hypothetical protein